MRRYSSLLFVLLLATSSTLYARTDSAAQRDWSVLTHGAYPNEWATGGVAQMIDGVYRERNHVGEVCMIVLNDRRAFGDLDGDGREDAALLLIARPPAGGVYAYLVAVLDRGDHLHAISSQRLGDRTFPRSIRINAGIIEVILDSALPNDPAAAPSQRRRWEFTLHADQLEPIKIEALPPPTLPAPMQPAPQDVALPDASTTIIGAVDATAAQSYRVHISAAYTLTVALVAPHDRALLELTSADGTTLKHGFAEGNNWRGIVPAEQDYTISVIGIGVASEYSLYIERTAPPPPASDKIIYLTFDDGPDPTWTPQILDLLARHNATATFFVIGRSAQAYPQLVQAEYAAGHGIGNHTYSHRALTTLSQAEFANEVLGTHNVVGDFAAPCLRPPYGYVNGAVYAQAAQLGYTVMLWNVDPHDWQRPGADSIVANVLAHVHDRAIVILHDGGGDRSQTVAALESILAQLSAQGYRFEPLCR